MVATGTDEEGADRPGIPAPLSAASDGMGVSTHEG